MLLKELPVIRRARDFHLYDNGGRRFLDLYLNGGGAILGHRPEKFSLELKNTLSRGVYAQYPSHEEKKLYKAAQALWGSLFPRIRYYRSSTEVIYLFIKEGIMVNSGDIADPAMGEKGPVSLWRPWAVLPEDALYVFPVLPVPGMETGVVVCSRGDLILPEGDLPSPVTAAGITRCLWSLHKQIGNGHYFDPETEKSLPGFSGWEKRGPYMRYLGSREEYSVFFKESLAAGVLLPPDPAIPAILPSVLTSGDLKLLKKIFAKES